MGLARQPPQHLQSRLRGSERESLERAEALGVVGPHVCEPAGSQDGQEGAQRQVGRVRRARLHADDAAVTQGQPGRHHHGAALGDRRVHHAAGGQGVDLRACRACGRPVPDPLRAA